MGRFGLPKSFCLLLLAMDLICKTKSINQISNSLDINKWAILLVIWYNSGISLDSVETLASLFYVILSFCTYISSIKSNTKRIIKNVTEKWEKYSIFFNYHIIIVFSPTYRNKHFFLNVLIKNWWHDIYIQKV